MFSEVKCDHHDEAMNAYVVDGYRTDDPNESGVVIANVCCDTKKVWWTDMLYAHQPECKAIVAEVLADIEKEFTKVKTPNTQLYQLYDSNDEILMLVQGVSDMDEEIQTAYREWEEEELEALEDVSLEDYLEEKLQITRVFVENVNL